MSMINVSECKGDGCTAVCSFSVSTFRVVSADEMRVSLFVSRFWSFVVQENVTILKSSRSLRDGCIKKITLIIMRNDLQFRFYVIQQINVIHPGNPIIRKKADK